MNGFWFLLWGGWLFDVWYFSADHALPYWYHDGYHTIWVYKNGDSFCRLHLVVHLNLLVSRLRSGKALPSIEASALVFSCDKIIDVYVWSQIRGVMEGLVIIDASIMARAMLWRLICQQTISHSAGNIWKDRPPSAFSYQHDSNSRGCLFKQ